MQLHFGRAMLLLNLLFWMTPVETVGAPNMVDTMKIIKLIRDVTTSLLKAWDLVENLPLDTNETNSQRQILQSIGEVSDQIRDMEDQQAEYFQFTIETLRRDFYTESLFAHKMSFVSDINRSILQRYQNFIDYERYKEIVNPYTLRSFAEWNVKPGPSAIGSLLDTLHSYVYGEADDDTVTSLFSNLVANYEANVEKFCAFNRSPQQFAYDLYTKSILIEIKGHIMVEFSWMVLRDMGMGNFSQEISLMRSKYDQRMLHSEQLLHQVMARTGRVYWCCDPRKGAHVLGKTYDEVTRLMQGYVENEINMNAEASCWQTCEYYQNGRFQGYHEHDLSTKQPKCAGRIHSCRFIESDMNVCQASANSSRRYEQIHYDSGRVLGGSRNQNCFRGYDRIESWWYWLVRCDYCFCLCDEPGPQSDRYFSLRDSLSDFAQNKVVTGARFVKNLRVFHLQLQQGELLPGGAINQSSLDWIPLESFDVNHVDIRSGYDYHELTLESRSLDLDEITAENDSHVVTGARFRVIDKHLNLEVRFSRFNFTTGRLLQPEVNSFWLGNNADVPRQKLLLNDPNISTLTPVESLPISKHNQYMDFISTSIDKDAAQNTVPFIDVQDVVTNNAMPISGLGIYHKGHKGYGGFFAPKIVTYNLLQHLQQL